MAKKRPKKYGRHSKAGYAYLMEEKRKKEPAYFRGIKRDSTETQLRRQGLTEKEIASFSGSKLKRKKK